MDVPETKAESELGNTAELCLFGGAPNGHTIEIDDTTRRVLRNLVTQAYRRGRSDAVRLLSTPSAN